jgi:AraC family transcriptional regulator, regulatory protein of adaptative response / DNA-3-methyladenine glycosylase II
MKSATLQLAYEPPYDWLATLSFLSRRAIDDVEQVEDRRYRRTIHCDGQSGRIEVAHHADSAALIVEVSGPVATLEGEVKARLRRLFDLDADLPRITAHLARDSGMAQLVARRPTVRVFGGWDGFEVAARTVIGQQVTVERARRLNGVLVERCGPVAAPVVRGLGRLFPTPRQVVDADLSAMGMPGARAATLKAVAAAAIDDPQLFERAGSLDETIARLRGIRGIGDWTAHYIAMRACREPDAFPASDVGLLRGAADRAGRRPTPAELTARAEAWRPWRAYAAHQLWAVDNTAGE